MWPVAHGIVDALDDTADLEAEVGRWGRPLSRVALASAVVGRAKRPGNPKAVQAMIDLDLVPEGWAARVGDLTAAAGRVLDALDTPETIDGFDDLDHFEDFDDDLNDFEEDDVAGSFTLEDPTPDDEIDEVAVKTIPDHDIDTVSPVSASDPAELLTTLAALHDPTRPAVNVGDGTVADCETLLLQVRAAVEVAALTFVGLAADLADGVVPDPGAVTAAVAALHDAAGTALQLRAGLGGGGVDFDPAGGVTVAGLNAAVQTLRDRLDPGIVAAGRLGAITGPAEMATVISGLHAAAADPANRDFALALTALIDAAARGASALGNLAVLDAAARQAPHPAELDTAILLAALGQLTLPDGPTIVTAPPVPARHPGLPDAPGEPATDFDDAPAMAQVSTPAAGLEPEPPAAEPEAVTAPETSAPRVEEIDDGELPTDDAGGDGTATASTPVSEPAPIISPARRGDASPTGDQDEPVATGPGRKASGATSRSVPSPTHAPRVTLAKITAPEPDNDDIPDDKPAPAREHDSESEQLLVETLQAGRLGLAYWADRASGDDASLLRLTALAAAVSAPTGPVADALLDAATDADHRAHGPGVLALAAVAALRGALVAPYAGTAAVAVNIAQLLQLPGLTSLAEAAQQAALRGVTLVGDTLSGLGDAARLDAAVRDAAHAAYDAIGRDRRFGFHRANDIWKKWCSPTGPLGAPYAAVMANDHTAVTMVRAAAADLRARGELERLLRVSDDAARGNGSKRIEGSARKNLLDSAVDALSALTGWCDAVDRLTGRAGGAAWLDGPTADLRTAAEASAPLVAAELAAIGGDPVDQAAVEAARVVLVDALGLIAGQAPTAAPGGPDSVLGADLLRSDARLDTDLRPVTPPTVEQLAVALDRSLDEAFAARLAAGDHVGTGAIADLVAATDSEAAAHLSAERAAAFAAGRASTDADLHTTRELLDRARRQLHVTEDRYTALSSRLEGAARVGRADLDVVAAELDTVRAEVRAATADAIAEFRVRVADQADTNPAIVPHRARIDALVDNGDLATAAELLHLAADGRSLADADEGGLDLTAVWPGAADALSAGIDDALLDALAGRRDHGGLPYSHLTVDAAGQAHEALRRWQRLARGHKSRDLFSELKPVLRLCGIDATAEEAATRRTLPASPQRVWLELTGVTRTGNALVPDFGSAAGSRQRVLAVWGSPNEATLLDWATVENSDRPVTVLHFGPFPVEARLRLAAACRERRSRPAIIIIDDIVLAWAAAGGEFRYEPLMRATLPFAAVDPYLPPPGDCPPEMFYGRSAARRDVIDANGSCLVYGGRQLGKSALLRSAVRDIDSRANQVAVYIDLKDLSIGATRRADEVWELLWRRLGGAGVAPAGRPAGRDAHVKVSDAVRAWLAADDGRRILVCLDESDDYFDADAATNFVTTTRLKTLMTGTGRRFKVVWAGLHQVARFANIPNQPLSHLGDPIAIGPLDPHNAHRLIADPMRALGLEFDPPELVNRVLAYANYQPVLLHLFGRALVERMLFSGRETTFPPVHIRAGDVEAVADSRDLQAAIREKFELTLGLDPRYRLITYTVAREAHERGVETALTASELRAECERWWPAGFADLDPYEFRALLEELVSLGVLAGDGSRYRLRSPNVLRMLGTVAQVEDRLLEEENREPTVLVATEARRALPDKTHSPVTDGQLADLIGHGRNQVRVVVGSEATCVEVLGTALESAEEATGRFKLRRPGRYGTYTRSLTEGERSEHAVVLSDVRGTDSLAKSLEAATSRLPQKGGTRAVALLADASNYAELAALIDPSGDVLSGVEVTPLRRLDHRGLRAWAFDVEFGFQDDQARQELAEVTGGWPALLEDAAACHRKGMSARQTLDHLAGHLASPEGAAELVALAGVGRSGPLGRLVNDLAGALGNGSLPAADLAEFVTGDARPHAVVAMLRHLGILEPVPGTEGELRLEPVFARSWLLAPPPDDPDGDSDPDHGTDGTEDGD